MSTEKSRVQDFNDESDCKHDEAKEVQKDKSAFVDSKREELVEKLRERCDVAGIEHKAIPKLINIYLPSGRNKVLISSVLPQDMKDLLSIEFEKIVIIEEYFDPNSEKA